MQNKSGFRKVENLQVDKSEIPDEESIMIVIVPSQSFDSNQIQNKYRCYALERCLCNLPFFWDNTYRQNKNGVKKRKIAILAMD